jgi:hypothetical protein
MPIILTSSIVAVLLAVSVGLALTRMQQPAYVAKAMPETVRIDDPGHNLVGPDWSGLNKPPQNATQVSHADTRSQ